MNTNDGRRDVCQLRQTRTRIFRGLLIESIAALSCAMAITQAPTTKTSAQNQSATSPKDLRGIWQGILHATRDERLKLKITQAADGKYQLTLYRVDQNGQSFEATKTTFVDGTLKFTMDIVSSRYEGKISPDGNTITGTWTQGLNPIALNLERTREEEGWPTPEPVKLMAEDAHPKFEVATIKPSQPNEPGKGFGYSDGSHTTTWHTSVDDLIAVAYGLHAKQIDGAPAWLGTNLYDIEGKADIPGKASTKQIGEMLQGLLADRFALKFHREQRELSVYALQIAAGGPKMKETASGPNAPQRVLMPTFGDLYVGNLTMKQFASWMQTAAMDKPVLDQTGLTASYDFHLRWTADDSQFAPFRGTNGPVQPSSGDNPNMLPSLYTALQEQLGLKFAATKAMVDVIVIDHVEQPSAN